MIHAAGTAAYNLYLYKLKLNSEKYAEIRIGGYLKNNIHQLTSFPPPLALESCAILDVLEIELSANTNNYVTRDTNDDLLQGCRCLVGLPEQHPPLEGLPAGHQPEAAGLQSSRLWEAGEAKEQVGLLCGQLCDSGCF